MTAIDRCRRPDHDERRDALAGRFGEAMLGAFDLPAVYLGDRLGLYRALADGGRRPPPSSRPAAGIDPRYAREWLEQQAVGRHPRRRRRRRRAR